MFCIIIGKRFASPIKPDLRSKRSKSRNDTKFLLETDTSSDSRTPISNVGRSLNMSSQPHLQVFEIGESSSTDSQSACIKSPESSQDKTTGKQTQEPDPVIYAALLAKIELLEAENSKLKKQGKIFLELKT